MIILWHISVRVYCYSIRLLHSRWSFETKLFSSILFQKFDCILKTRTSKLLISRVDIFYIKFGFFESFIVINSATRILLIETLYKFRTLSVDLSYI